MQGQPEDSKQLQLEYDAGALPRTKVQRSNDDAKQAKATDQQAKLQASQLGQIAVGTGVVSDRSTRRQIHSALPLRQARCR